MATTDCAWCGVSTTADDRFEVYEPSGLREAYFCRLEHVVPWSIRGAHWNATEAVPSLADGGNCSFCGEATGPARINLLRHRAGVVVDDLFCNVEHLASWAKAGGRYARR